MPVIPALDELMQIKLNSRPAWAIQADTISMCNPNKSKTSQTKPHTPSLLETHRIHRIFAIPLETAQTSI